MRTKYLAVMMLALNQTASGIETDKAAHFGVSHFLTIGSYGIAKTVGLSPTESLMLAGFVVGTIGVTKEVIDYKTRGQFGWGDLLADGLGIGSAIGFAYGFNF